ncbi:DUF4190 domain-containing protein [Streptomyces sp. CAU 1734]|uniref:DUF4190 domain-containing protein n=1 Tax=Streptomyces sp. CAU 1734 TaxID=3140360 RepID=UPI003261B2EF
MYASRSHSGFRPLSAASPLALVSVVFGVLGFFFLSLLLAPLAVLTGYLALRRSGRDGAVLAKAGIVLGAGVLVLYAVLMVAGS